MPSTLLVVDAALMWLAGATQGSFIVIDAKEVVVFANAGAYKLMGLDPAEHSVVGSHIERVFSYTGSTRAQSPILRRYTKAWLFTKCELSRHKACLSWIQPQFSSQVKSPER